MNTVNEEVGVQHLVQAMQSGSLPRAQWTHAAHLVVGTWHVHTLGLSEALQAMPTLIRAYNVATGTANSDSSGYHETLTVAYLREIARQLSALSLPVELSTAVQTVLSSDLARSDWPLRYWSRERLGSVAARRSWIEPDLAPLPV